MSPRWGPALSAFGSVLRSSGLSRAPHPTHDAPISSGQRLFRKNIVTYRRTIAFRQDRPTDFSYFFAVPVANRWAHTKILPTKTGCHAFCFAFVHRANGVFIHSKRYTSGVHHQDEKDSLQFFFRLILLRSLKKNYYRRRLLERRKPICIGVIKNDYTRVYGTTR